MRMDGLVVVNKLMDGGKRQIDRVPDSGRVSTKRLLGIQPWKGWKAELVARVRVTDAEGARQQQNPRGGPARAVRRVR